MKVSRLKNRKIDKPFYQDDKISLTFKTTDHKITAIEAVNGKRRKTFLVSRDDILKTFKDVEKFFAKIK